MCKLYKEYWWLIKEMSNKHEIEIESFNSIEEARSRLVSDYMLLSSGYKVSLLLEDSFIIVRHDEKVDYIIKYEIFKEIEKI